MSWQTPLFGTTGKVFILIFLCLLLLIPLNMVEDLIRERAGLAQQAEQSIARGWGGEQLGLLPMLQLKYQREVLRKEETSTETQFVYLSAQSATVEGRLSVEERAIGIHRLPVYNASLNFRGRFASEDFPQHGSEADAWRLVRAGVVLAPGDLTGLREIKDPQFAGQPLRFVPTSIRLDAWNAAEQGDLAAASLGAHKERAVLLAELPLTQLDPALGLNFDIAIELAGARSLKFIPNAGELSVVLSGAWPHPSFLGAVLPRERKVGVEGFAADWKVMNLSTGIPTVLCCDLGQSTAWNAQALGVSLVQPGGTYQQNERSGKYGFMVLALTLAALFLSELLLGVRLHPLHYLQVGLALAVFYLLLLALSEHFGFDWSYLVAAGTVVLLVAAYMAAVLRRWWRGALCGGLLASLYVFLYVIIGAEEMSLLLGAVGLTAILAAAMYLTRRIDWYSPAPISAPADPA